jgi:uncharacterized protein
MECKKILFAHSAGEQGSKGEGSYDLVSYLQEELVNEYEISYPIIEVPESPTYKNWKNMLQKEFTAIEEPVILVGHSLGGSVLLKYLSEESPKILVLALFLVAAPHWGKDGWNVEDFVLNENFELKLNHIKHVFLYHCKEDEIVPFKHLSFYQKAFPNATVRLLNGTDHVFANGLPELVNDIKKLNHS